MEVTIYHLRTRDVLTLSVLGLLLLGVVMVQSASAGAAMRTDWQWSAGALKESAFAAAGVGIFFIVGAINYTWIGRRRLSRWRSPVMWMLGVTALANAVVLVPHVGVAVNGARRWLRLGPMQVQPSELAKWAVVIYLAYWLSKRPIDLNRFFRGFLPTLIPVAALCLLVIIEDFGTATLIALTALLMLLVGRVRWWHLAIVIPPVVAAGLWFVMHKEYRWRRITAFENPYAAPQREGYHMIQSLLSFATGGWTGRGLGNGVQKLGYLPEDTTDFIFSVICEELGIFGAMLTVAFYLGILYCTWQTVKMKGDSFGKMLAFGVGIMVSLQAMINIAVATVSVPTKGLSLPLVSAGGSGLIITCAALGLLKSTARFKNRADDPVDPLAIPGVRAKGKEPEDAKPISDSMWQKFTTA
jgi:cell division protein FtsW